MLAKPKDIDEVLREEFFRERAATLAKACERLQAAIDKMCEINEEILRLQEGIETPLPSGVSTAKVTARAALIKRVNEAIARYNAAREYAQLRYYYLIVTREALGLRHHKTVEEFFRIGAKKDYHRNTSGECELPNGKRC